MGESVQAEETGICDSCDRTKPVEGGVWGNPAWICRDCVLRSAADRLTTRGAELPRLSGDHQEMVGRARSFWADADAVAKAYLAEHPADDAEPVTGEWLREIGFVAMRPARVLKKKAGGTSVWWWPEPDRPADWIVATDDRELEMSDQVPESLCPRTRGDVRRLLATLGIS